MAELVEFEEWQGFDDATATPFDPGRETEFLFGPGVLARIGEVLRERGAHHVLLVTDAGLVAAGHVARAEQVLAAAGLRCTRFDRVCENPSTRDVDACLEVARRDPPDHFLGLGGGSCIDTAKGCNLLLTSGGRLEDYWGFGKAPAQPLPLMAVPTTAGTGTESQSFALIARASDHQKMACGQPGLAPRIAVLDPELTVTQPRAVTAMTGMDTITHAVESFVTRRRNPVSCAYSREAFRLAATYFPRVLADGRDLRARAGMLKAAAWAGLAIENSMLGAAHSLANPLTAHFGVGHGQAVGMMLPHVVRFNGETQEPAGWYAELCAAAGIALPGPAAAPAALAARIDELLRLAGLRTALAELGVPAGRLPALAAEAARQWTAQFNPRTVGEPELVQLYERSFAARGSP